MLKVGGVGVEVIGEDIEFYVAKLLQDAAAILKHTFEHREKGILHRQILQKAVKSVIMDMGLRLFQPA